MKSIIWIGVLNFIISSTYAETGDWNKKENNYRYKLKLGWFTLGDGQVSITEDDTIMNQRYMHEVKAHTSTLGLGNWLSNLDDDYLAYVDSKSLKSYRSYKDVTYGSSHWEQWNHFDYDKEVIDIKALDHRKSQPERVWKVELEDGTYDILGTFMFFKSAVDWDTIPKNDFILIKTLYKKDLYRVGLKYLGKERIKFNGEKVLSHKLRLLVPDQEKLRDDRPVYIWMTADEHQHPLRIYSKLFIGSARCELESINGKSPSF